MHFFVFVLRYANYANYAKSLTDRLSDNLTMSRPACPAVMAKQNID